jgi:hypothetical protein
VLFQYAKADFAPHLRAMAITALLDTAKDESNTATTHQLRGHKSAKGDRRGGKGDRKGGKGDRKGAKGGKGNYSRGGCGGGLVGVFQEEKFALPGV